MKNILITILKVILTILIGIGLIVFILVKLATTDVDINEPP